MKALFIFIFLFNTTLFAQKPVSVMLQNPSSFSRSEEPVLLSKKFLQSKGVKEKPSIVTANGKPVQVQFDDMDGDGNWDEMVFLQSFGSKEAVQLVLIFDKKVQQTEKPRTHIRFGKDASRKGDFKQVAEDVFPPGLKPTPYSVTNMPMYQAEGPIWENDKIAFRLYFDVRNGKDIFGKTTTRLVADSIGLPKADYHSLQPWGMDVLKVGASLGAGAVAFYKKVDGKDSLVRLGGDVKETRCKIMADGPVRSVLRLNYKGFAAFGQQYDVMEEISIWGGQYWYQSRISVSTTEPMEVATGIVNLLSNEVERISEGNCQASVTHDKQSENKDILGLAIIAVGKNLTGFGEAPKANASVQSTYYQKAGVTTNAPFVFRFYGGWELSDKNFADKSYFVNFIKSQIQQLNTPIIIR